jgi:hypothetical protein
MQLLFNLATPNSTRRSSEERVTAIVLLLTSALTAGLYALLWIAT